MLISVGRKFVMGNLLSFANQIKAKALHWFINNSFGFVYALKKPSVHLTLLLGLFIVNHDFDTILQYHLNKSFSD